VLAEKDLVATRNRLDFLGTIYATGDFFRIGCDGKIAEHWDAMQDISQIPPNSPNPHPFW
jgi:predicted SnoaL-like aldol condensation-catalyzing enzyme